MRGHTPRTQLVLASTALLLALLAPLPVQGDAPSPESTALMAELERMAKLERKTELAREAEIQLLDAATDEVCGVLFQRRPWLARELGRDSHDGLLGPFDALERTRWDNSLADASRLLARVRGALLPPDRLPDLLWLRALLDAESLARGALPSARRDPGIYVRHAAGSLGATLQTPGLPLADRAAALRGWLENLPVLTAAARQNLTETVAPWTEIALEDLVDLEQLTSVVVASVVRNPALSEEELEQGQAALERGLDALHNFQSYLTERVLPIGGASFHMTSDSWRGALHSLTGAEVDLDALELRLLRNLGRLDRELGGAVRERSLQSAETGSAHQLVTVTAGKLALLAPKVGLRPPPGRGFVAVPSALGRGFRPVAEWQPGAFAPGVLVIGVPSPRWPSQLQRKRAAELNRSAQIALAVRYGPLGEWGLRARGTQSLLPGRVALENFPLRVGFGLYATDWALRVPSIAPVINEKTRDELRRQRYDAALQLYTALLLHGRQEPFDEVVETWVLHTGDDQLMSRRAVVLVSRTPFAGAGYLSYLELLRLERELRGEDPDAVAALRTVDFVVRYPSGRPVDLLEHREALMPHRAPVR